MAIAGNFGVPLHLAVSGAVKSTAGVLFGFLCETSTAGTIDLYDGTGTGGTHFLQAFPVSAGNFTPIPAGFTTGLYATLTNCTGCFIYG